MTTPTQQWSDWIAHDGSECPIPWAKGGEYRIRFSNGEEGLATELDDADTWGWAHSGHEYDIAFYSHIIRTTGAPADGGCPECGGSGKILDRVDGEITCPGCGYPQSPFYTSAERVNETAESEHVEPSPSLVEAAEAMAAALENATRRAKVAIGAIQSRQIIDKDVEGILAALAEEAKAALALYRSTSKEG